MIPLDRLKDEILQMAYSDLIETATGKAEGFTRKVDKEVAERLSIEKQLAHDELVRSAWAAGVSGDWVSDMISAASDGTDAEFASHWRIELERVFTAPPNFREGHSQIGRQK